MRSSLRVALLVMMPGFCLAQPPLVIVDAGHSKERPGSVSPGGVPEYRYNRQLAQMVANRLRSAGLAVIETGSDGKHIALPERARDSGKAALFLSLHHDSFKQVYKDAGREREFKGFSIFVSRKNPFWPQSVNCARHIGQALVDAGEEPSRYHASPIEGENRAFVDEARGVHRFDDLVVLKAAKSPALLVEAGVIANPDEEGRLLDTRVAGLLAQQISAAVMGCLMHQ